jgi:MFS family permease
VEFRRDRLTYLAYALLAWFAYLQAAPGLIVPHLRDELDIGYSVGGLHVAAFAAGSVIAGLTSGRLEQRLGRRTLFWASTALMGTMTVALTLGRTPTATIGALLVMGIGGTLLLITIQAALSDHHRECRAVALTEANVAAAVSYVVLIGALSLAAATGAGWRAALLASLALPVVLFLRDRRERIDAPPPEQVAKGPLPRAFWIASAMLFCTTAAEWCVTAWGASFVEAAADVSVDTAVALMIGFYLGVVAGRTLGSRLTRTHPPQRLLAGALALTAVGFAVLWPSTTPAQAIAGLLIVGLGLGNLFPLGLAFTVSLVPERAQFASSRAVLASSGAVLLAPLTVGALADATSLTAALGVVPIFLALAAVGLTYSTRSNPPASTKSSRPVRQPRTESRTSGVGRSR